MAKCNALSWLWMSSALVAGGCADVQQPLIFVSENNLGVDIGASPADTQSVKLTLGYKNRDVSFVPVTAIDKAGRHHDIRGCYRTVLGAVELVPCGLADATSTARAPEKATPVAEAGAGSNEFAKFLPVQALPVEPRPSGRPFSLPLPNNVLPAPFAGEGDSDDVKSKALALISTGKQSMIDSLSVFSSFNADARAGTQADVGLGKVFATGIAAQQLTEGQNYFLQYKGQALRYAVTECINALIKAKGEGKVTEKEVLGCSGAKGTEAAKGTGP